MNTLQRGFTLLELMVVVAIIALASAGVGFALRSSEEAALEREGQRLAALLEAGRAQSRASGVAALWRPTPGGFRFDGLQQQDLPSRWLHETTRATLESAATRRSGAAPPQALVLGPEPLIGPQSVLLQSADQPDKRLRVATDGLRPFAVVLAGQDAVKVP
ncbi:MAG: prepilin-type N-terminal cleavage/methylation domain-containing protein [Burkholderiaceae bacterium]